MRLVFGIASAFLAVGAAWAQGAPPSKPFQVKVYIVTRMSLVDVDQRGIATPMRTSLEPFQVEAIKAAAKDYGVQLKSLSGGVIDAKVSVEEDSDQVALMRKAGEAWGSDSDLTIDRFVGKSSSLFGEVLSEGLAPRINSEAFQANDGIFRGPYNIVFVVHPSLAPFDKNFVINGVPGRSIGWNTFSSKEPQSALVRQFLDSTRELAGGPEVRIPTPPAPEAPVAYGESELTTTGDVLKLVSTGVIARGGAFLKRISLSETPVLKFKARGSSREPMAINPIGDKGPIASILVRGRIPGSNPLLFGVYSEQGTRLEAGEAWTEFAIDLRQLPRSEEVKEIHLGTPGLVLGPFEKGPPEQTTIEISGVSVSADTAGLQAIKPIAETADVEALVSHIALLKGSVALTDEAWTKTSAFIASLDSRERASVIVALGSQKDARATALLAPLAGSGGIAESYLASISLAAQGTPEAKAALAAVLKKGPFDSNRRFAAEAMIGKVEAADVPLLNMMMLQRGWRGRLAAARALMNTTSRESQIVLTSSLAHELEPNAAVRLTIASSLDPAFELAARRLLFSGVNDPSNWVRAIALSRLLESPFDPIRMEAMKGVKDDAILVRLAVLSAMTVKPQAGYRSALRLAVADAAPEVRAAALRGFEAQADPTQPGEIENTFADKAESVQLALVRLAASKKVALPESVLSGLKSSEHQSVRTAAAALGGRQ